MDETSPLKGMKALLETIRERANYGLQQIAALEEVRSLRWRCTTCGHVKRFTRPVPKETADDCPKCKATEFVVER
jgi:rubrerythrin